MLTVRQLPAKDFDEVGVVYEALGQTVHQWTKTADCLYENHASRAQDPAGPLECDYPICAIGEMVQRPQQQYSANRLVLLCQPTCVADAGGSDGISRLVS